MTTEDDLRQALAQIGDPAVTWDDVDPDDGLHRRSVRAFARATVTMSLVRVEPDERAHAHAASAESALRGLERARGYPQTLAICGIEAITNALLAIEARLEATGGR